MKFSSLHLDPLKFALRKVREIHQHFECAVLSFTIEFLVNKTNLTMLLYTIGVKGLKKYSVIHDKKNRELFKLKAMSDEQEKHAMINIFVFVPGTRR